MPATEARPKAEYRIEIVDWLPTSLSTLAHCHWRVRQRAKASDGLKIHEAACRAKVPFVRLPADLAKARRMFPNARWHDPIPFRRRVRLEITLAKGVRARDQDNMAKSILDGLKRAGYLFDDSPKWAEFCLPFPYTRGAETCTTIILEDIEPYVMARESKPKRPRKKASATT